VTASADEAKHLLPILSRHSLINGIFVPHTPEDTMRRINRTVFGSLASAALLTGVAGAAISAVTAPAATVAARSNATAIEYGARHHGRPDPTAVEYARTDAAVISNPTVIEYASPDITAVSNATAIEYGSPNATAVSNATAIEYGGPNTILPPT
jgi:hypothetical protein